MACAFYNHDCLHQLLSNQLNTGKRLAHTIDAELRLSPVGYCLPRLFFYRQVTACIHSPSRNLLSSEARNANQPLVYSLYRENFLRAICITLSKRSQKEHYFLSTYTQHLSSCFELIHFDRQNAGRGDLADWFVGGEIVVVHTRSIHGNGDLPGCNLCRYDVSEEAGKNCPCKTTDLDIKKFLASSSDLWSVAGIWQMVEQSVVHTASTSTYCGRL